MLTDACITIRTIMWNGYTPYIHITRTLQEKRCSIQKCRQTELPAQSDSCTDECPNAIPNMLSRILETLKFASSPFKLRWFQICLCSRHGYETVGFIFRLCIVYFLHRPVCNILSLCNHNGYFMWPMGVMLQNTFGILLDGTKSDDIKLNDLTILGLDMIIIYKPLLL